MWLLLVSAFSKKMQGCVGRRKPAAGWSCSDDVTFFHYSLLSIQSPHFLLQISECTQATYKLIARGAVRVFVFVCVCRCLGQVTLGMHCPFVPSCSCASTRALSLIHTDLVKSDVKECCVPTSNSVCYLRRKCVFIWRCLGADGTEGVGVWGGGRVNLIWLRLVLWLEPRLGLQPSISNNYSLVELNASS